MVGQKEQVRFLDRDPVPPSLRGREARVEQMNWRAAIVWVGGIRRCVPKSWLVPQRSDAPDSSDLDVDQGSLVPVTPVLTQPADPDTEGDDEPITQQAWYCLLEACLELNLSREDAQQVIAEAVGVSPDDLDPSRLTWQQYLQAIERLEQLESRS
jgi:hypothetical protein